MPACSLPGTDVLSAITPAVTPRSGSPAAASGPPVAADARLGSRLTILLFAFCLWAVVIVLRMGQFMIVERGRYLEAMTREALFQGVVPAARGRILDRDGRPLAWSERVFTVHWHIPRRHAEAEALLAFLDREPWLTAALPRPLADHQLGERVELAHDLTAARAMELEDLADQVPGLEIRAAFRRHVVAEPHLRQYIGLVRTGPDGTEVGISGIEREHDDILRGLPGTFQVMLDKEGRWLPETWRKVGELRPGFDVQLPLRADSREEPAP